MRPRVWVTIGKEREIRARIINGMKLNGKTVRGIALRTDIAK